MTAHNSPVSKTRVRKIHYYGDSNGQRCGTVRPSYYASVPNTLITNNPSGVTCKACLHLMKKDGVS